MHYLCMKIKFLDMLKIKELCKEKGVQLSELAKALNITPGALSQNIAGRAGLDRLQKIANFLNVDIRDLFVSNDFTAMVNNKGEMNQFNSIKELKKYVDLLISEQKK